MMIGKKLLHYEIIEKLGEGGMGEVYRARDTKLPREVAIKLIPEHLAGDPERRKRFEREAAVIASLNHPNIVTIYSIEEVDGIHFLAMELVDGQTLSDAIPSGGLALDKLFKIAVPLADAIHSAHAKGVAHRDLKPANIMIDTNGRVKVLDFGLAKLFESDLETERTVGPDSETGEGQILGTVAYMSPEQAEGKSIDHRSDIFTLGIILHQMATGERPFKGETRMSTLSSIIKDDPPSVTDVKRSLPRHLGRIVKRCLAKEPDRRYQAALDIRNELEGLQDEITSGEVEMPVATPRRQRQSLKIGKPLGIGLVAVAVVAAAVFLWPKMKGMVPSTTTTQQASVTELQSIAVLPFVNLGEPQDEYFADGITDEIISKLAVIKGLAVISRTSSMKYKKSEKGLREIGQELGVEYILEGTIRWDKRGERERVRITPQLINVSDDFHLWAESYEREIEGIFAVQADIASQIAEALDITLLESDRQTLEAKPTENLDAYQAYLRGVNYIDRPDYTKENVQLGIQMLERTVELDPEFALSYATLSKAHSGMHHHGWDSTEERLSRAKAAVDQALELQPELPEAHLAFAYYHYWGRRNYERALEELAIAERGLPNDSRILEATANIWRRQGKFEAAVDRRKRAFELSPQDAGLPYEIAVTYVFLRRHAEADRYFDLSISLAPDQQWAYGDKAYNYIYWLGDTKRARDVLEKMPGKRRDVQEMSLWLWRVERNYQAILDFASSDSRPIIWDQVSAWPPALLAARAYQFMEEPELAHASYDSARAILENELDARPDDHRIRSALGIAYAGLGRKEDAIREGKRGVELQPVSKDALIGSDRVWDLADIYTMVGEYDDAALDEIEYLLSIPSYMSVPWLRLDPIWDPLREHPRFQALLEKYPGVR